MSCAEKSWVVFHPFVAKKALQLSLDARTVTTEVKQQKLLKGEGNGDQVDAFRHTYWMALLTLEIGERRARKLGKAHEKGNHQQFKKGKTEDGVLPDKIASEMDLFNNELGISIAKTKPNENLKSLVIDRIKKGEGKIIKQDQEYHFLDAEGNIIPSEELKGKWKNRKVLVNSDY
ncbi:MAG: hypothetical protein AB7O47_04600 [Flavobacteriales bacterium]